MLALFMGAYVGDYYPADEEAVKYMESGGLVTVLSIKGGWLFDGPGEEKALIFYPGAKVESTAYAPLLYRLAECGIDCFLIDMPYHLAIFGENRADAVIEKYSYGEWYLSGHSLGGAMAAIHASRHIERLDGLILLAAYPTRSLEGEGFRVLSVYGSEDRVQSYKRLEAGRDYMPEQYTEVCIEGGNHAQYGSYGFQKGDGQAFISPQEQREQTVRAILAFVEQSD